MAALRFALVVNLLFVLLPTGFSSGQAFSETKTNKKALSEQHLEKLRNDINELQAYLKAVQDDHKGLVQSLRKSDQEVAKVSKQVETLRKALNEERARLKKLKAQRRVLGKQQQTQQTTLKNIILASYKMGQEPKLKMLLNQQDAKLLSRNLSYLQHFNSAHQKQIAQYRQTLSEVDTLSSEVQKQQDSLKDKLALLKQSHQQLKSKQRQQQKNASALNKKIKNSDVKLARLQQDRQQLIEVLGRVEEVFLSYERTQESRPFKSLKGKLPSPIHKKPKRLFGQWHENGKQKWLGWTYPGSAGSHIKAIHHGRVVFSDWLRGFGLLTIVDHGQGYMSLYARNQALLKSVGDWVETGEVIAKLGRSGGYDKDALYFEIRHKGHPQNPKRWLKG